MVEIIAEIANAHQGRPEIALELANAIISSGADSVKFQIYFAEELLTKNHPRYEHFKKQSFSVEAWSHIIKEVKRTGVNLYADLFGLKAFDVAMNNGVDGYKIHSSDLSNERLLGMLSNTDKKVFLATGGSTIPEIKYAIDVVNSLGKPSEIVLLHGFQAFPTKVEDSVLSRMAKMKEMFGDSVTIGYSDHVDAEDKFATILPLMAIPYGITCIEKHVTLDRSKKGIDYYSSFEPREFKEFIKDVRIAEKSIGEKPLSFSDAERHYRHMMKKCWVASLDLEKGKAISNSDIIMKRTAEDVHSTQYWNISGKKLLTDIKEETPLRNHHFPHKILAIIVARMKSSRLKNKAIIDINGKPAISHLFERISICKGKGFVDTIAFCTTDEPSDDRLVEITKDYNFKIYRGSVDNVLSRMMLAIDDNPDHDIVLRITGDDLLIDCEYLEKIVKHYLETNADYTDAKNLPSGVEVEVFNAEVLRLISKYSKNPDGTEYLTNYIKNNQDHFNVSSLPVDRRHAKKYRLTLDTEEDYKVIKKLLEHMKTIGKEYSYKLDDIVEFFWENPEILEINSVIRQKSAPVNVVTEIDWKRLCKSNR